MATLNTLRTKGGAVLAVVIGVSLLAFLLGDLAGSGGILFNSSKMNVGRINGETVSYQEYLDRIERITRSQQIATGNDNLNDEQTRQVRTAAWESIARELSFGPSLENLGLVVSPDELTDMATGEWISPVISSIFVDPQTGRFDPELLNAYVANLDADPTGNSRFFWKYIENEMGTERVMSKYMSLVAGGVFTTDLEVERGVENGNRFFDVTYVSRPVMSVADSTVSVTDAKLRAYYDSHRRLFKQGESREMQYVVFEALPSEADFKDAEKSADEIAGQLRTSDDPVQLAKINGTDAASLIFLNPDELPSELREFGRTASDGDIYGPSLTGDKYTIARMVGRRSMPDTVGLRQIVLAPGSDAQADSLVAVLRKGGDFETLVAEYSLDRQTPGGDMGRINPAIIGAPGFEDYAKAVIGSKRGDIFSVETPYGIAIVENTYRGQTVEKVQVAVIEYLIEPGRQTQQEAYADASKFASSLAVKGADFNKLASESGLSVRVARLSEGDNRINGIDQSGEIARWAFEAAEGAHSDVFSIGDANYVAYVSSIREHGTVPFEKVKGDIRTVVLEREKVASLKEQMKGLSVTELSEKFGLEIKSASDINFASYYIADLGVAPAAIGAISGTPKGGTTLPVAAGMDVAVFEVENIDDRMETNDKSERVMLQSLAETNLQNRAYNAVFQLADIRDTRIRFF